MLWKDQAQNGWKYKGEIFDPDLRASYSGLENLLLKKKKILFILRFGCSVSSLRWAGVAREASPTLEGRYLTTGPPEKSLRSFFKLRIENFMPPKDSP